jgi:gliding motility-associated-like protein
VKVNYIRVLPSPVAAIEVLGNRLCANEPVVLSAAGGGDYVYNWDLGNGQTATTPVVFGFYPEGVYNVTLTVTNAQGICSDVTTLPITVRGQPNADFNVIPTSPGPPPNVDNCVPATIFFENNSTISSGNISGYFWQFGNLDTTSVEEPTFTFNEQGRYQVTLVVYGAFGCRDTAIKNVEIRPTPTARFTATNPVMEQPNNFTGFVNNSIEEPGSTHEWTFVGGDPPNSNQRDPGIITYPLLRRCYPVKLVVTDPQGCRDSTVDSVCVRPIQRIYVPNVFSPNGDRINDEFLIYNEGYDYNIIIFDRWGRRVFEGNNTQIWNGRINNTGEEVPEGAYAWRLTAFNFTTGPFNLAGTVTVLR